MLAVLMYHFIRDPSELKKLNLKGISKDNFLKQLSFLKKNYEIISFEDLDYILNKKKNKQKYALLTFDDGYLEHHDFVLPELISANLKGVFSVPLINFELKNDLLDINKIQILSNNINLQDKIIKKINFYLNKINVDISKLKYDFYVKGRLDDKKTNFIKKTLQLGFNIDKIKLSDLIFDNFYSSKLKKYYEKLYFKQKGLEDFKRNNMTFCAHGVTHNKFTLLNKKDLSFELIKSKNLLKKLNNHHKYGVVYPHGLNNRQVRLNVSKNGYDYGFTGGESIINNIKKIDKLNIFRIDTVDFNLLKNVS